MQAWKTIGRGLGWVYQILLAVMFIAFGTAKFMEPMWGRMFARWGYPDGFHMVVGALEVAGGLLLLVPRLASHTALMLIIVMIGATVTHVVHGEMQRVPVTISYIVLLSGVAWLRRKSTLRVRSPLSTKPLREGSVRL